MALENEAPIAAALHGNAMTTPTTLPPGQPLSAQARATAPPRAPVVDEKALAALPKELYDDLLREANDRGITLEQAYLEELEAQEELKRITPPIEELLRMARVGGAPEYMKNE